MQLRHERIEERRKLFKIVEKRQNVADTPLSRWKMILPALPQVKSELPRNSEITQRADVQIADGNSGDTRENKELAIDEESSRHNQMSDCNDSKRNEDEVDSKLNNTSSNKRYEINYTTIIERTIMKIKNA